MPTTNTPTMTCGNCLQQITDTANISSWTVTADRVFLCPRCGTAPARHRCPTCGIPAFNPLDQTNPCRVCTTDITTPRPAPTTFESIPAPTANHPWEPSTYFLKFPGSPHPLLASNRLIGLEIEALHPNSNRPPALSRFGILKPDGSLRRTIENHAAYCFELATWATSGHFLINFLADLCTTLRTEAVETNSTCGLHIHIDMTSSTHQQRTNLAFWWAIFEDLFFAIQPPTRRTGIFSKPAAGYNSIHEWESARYSALNLQAYTRHQTFEWRLGAGTIIHSEILLQVQLILAFVAAFEDRPPYSGPDDPDYQALLALDDRQFLSHFLKALGLPTSAVKGLLKRIRTYNADLLESPPLSSTPDAPENPDAEDAAYSLSGDHDDNDDHYDDDDESTPHVIVSTTTP